MVKSLAGILLPFGICKQHHFVFQQNQKNVVKIAIDSVHPGTLEKVVLLWDAYSFYFLIGPYIPRDKLRTTRRSIIMRTE